MVTAPIGAAAWRSPPPSLAATRSGGCGSGHWTLPSAVVTPVPAAPGLDELLAGYAALAAQLGGQFTALQGSPADALAKFAHQQQVTEILVARDPGASRHRVLNELTHRAGHAEVHVLPAPAR